MASTASIVINALIPPLTILAWLQILLGVGDSGDLAAKGRGSLKYFTVVSNLFSAAVSLVCLVLCIRGLAQFPRWLTALKLMASSAVMLTFFTVIVLLAPIYGWNRLCKGGNLWLHLLLPLFAAIDCCLFVPLGDLPLWMTLCAMVPTALYGMGYLRAVLSRETEEERNARDFYHFLRWGEEKILIVLAGMLLVSWAIGLGLWVVSWALGLLR